MTLQFSRENSHDIVRLRLRVSGQPLVTFDELDTAPKHIASAFEEEMDRMLEHGWERHGLKLPSLAPPIEWDSQNRSYSVHLHAWEPLSFLLKASCVVPDQAKCARYFDTSRAFAMDWLEKFQRPVIDREPADVLAEQESEASRAWYDMAVGQRIYRLAFILDALCRDPKYSDAEVEFAYRALHFHHRMLMVDGFFKQHSNHGLYQALGQLAASKRFMKADHESERYFDIAGKRLAALVDEHFTADNMHKEHSPGYHYMVLGSLVGATQTDLLPSDISDRVYEMEEALTWMIQPDSFLTTFGDSDPRKMARHTPSSTLAGRYSTSGLQYILSQGLIGSQPPSGVKPYYDAGYAFARLHAPNVEPKFENAAYLAQIAAFHSRVHKHADHLGFIWFDRGRDILIDPGRYAYAGRTEIGSDLFNQGFWYSDPKRIYVESTRAHNCVEIDGRSYPRRNVTPFGSALRYAGEQGGLAVTDCEMVHPRTTRHRRILVMAPGHFLLVLDWLSDRASPHDYRQWFQFAPAWTLTSEKERIVARAPALGATEPDAEVETDSGLAVAEPGHAARGAEALIMLNLIGDNVLGAPIRGQEEPELQGWMSDAAYSLVPCTSVAVKALSRPMARFGKLFAFIQRPMARFATLFVFGEDVELDRKRTRFNISMRDGTVCWSDGRGSHILRLSLGNVGEVDVILAAN